MFTSALATWRLWSDSEPELVHQLNGGLTNHSYLIQAKDKQWVLRINADNSAELDLNRVLESQILSLPGMALLGSRLVYCDPDVKFLVVEYLPGTVWPEGGFRSQEDITDLAILLNATHQLEVVEGRLDCQQKANNYWQHINSSTSLAQAIKKIQPAMAWHFDQARVACEAYTLCHNDLLAGNLISADDGCLYAIDWEYAAMGDPYFDLAVIVEGHELDTCQSQLLLKAYIGGVIAVDLDRAQQRLFHSRIIYGYLTLLWSVLQNDNHGGMDDVCDERLLALKVMLAEALSHPHAEGHPLS